MNADGSIVITVDMDDKEAQAELSKLNKKADGINKKLYENEKRKLPLVEQSKQLSVELDKAKAKLFDMQSAPKGTYTKDSLKEQADIVRGWQSDWNKTENAIASIDRSSERLNIQLDTTKELAGGVQQQLAVTSDSTRAMRKAVADAEKYTNRWAMRMREVVRSALVFTLISQSLALFRNWMGRVIKTSSEASGAIARLKGALLTLAQPLVEVIIPAFVLLVNVLTQVIASAARLVSALFGTTAKSSAEAAKNLNKETDALNSTAAAADKAGASLAGFDEINQIQDQNQGAGGGVGAGTVSSIAPDFSFLDMADERIKRIADAVKAVAAGLALWKISGHLPEALSGIAKKIAGLAIAVGGLILMWDGLTDAWKNGVDFGNLIEMIGGAALAAMGLYMAFGSVGAGIALVLSGAAMIVTAFRDIINNGANLQNTLLLIAGIVATGLGFFFLTGSVIPLVLAGIASVIVAVLGLTGNLQEFAKNLKENILGGIIDFIVGVFTGDWNKAWDGVKKVFKGAWNGIVILLESAINLIIKGLNWLIQRMNRIRFSVPDWVPSVGGKSYGINIPTIPSARIPRLAAGAVIPPNREFMAVLGDQRHGNNIEAPENLIRKIVREESGGMTVELLQAILEAIQAGQVIKVNETVLGRTTAKAINKVTASSGRPVLLY